MLDPRAGNVNVYIPQLKPDFGKLNFQIFDSAIVIVAFFFNIITISIIIIIKGINSSYF